MTTLLINSSFVKKISMLIFTFVLFSSVHAYAQPTITQSNCFTLTVATTSSTCSSNECDPEPYNGQCGECNEFTITHDKCSGLTISMITLTTPGDNSYDCRSVCGGDDFDAYVTTGGVDYDIEGICSWAGPRYMPYLKNNGSIPYLGSAKFIICRKNSNPINYTLTVTGNCGGTPCTGATITY